MFVQATNSNHKGNVAELKIAATAAELGIPVFMPLTEHGRYDLVLEIAGRLLRVQCKHAPRKGDVIVVCTVTNRRGPRGFIRTRYTADEVDAVAVYCPDVDSCYLLPIAMVDGMSGVHLRLAPPKNGQRAAIHYADDYLLGAVAQLGERCHGMAEARGSSPLSSTRQVDTLGADTVGANQFRNLFGFYLQRAAAGEKLLITRRGKPYARLLPLRASNGAVSGEPPHQRSSCR